MPLRVSTAAQAAQYAGVTAKPARKRATSAARPVADGCASAVRSVVLELPLPPTGCGQVSSGVSRDWRPKARATADYRAECLALLPRVSVPLFRRAEITLEFWHGGERGDGRYRARDAQRAIVAVTALVDAIVDAGYLRDDCAAVLAWGAVTIYAGKAARGKAGVVVTLTRRD